MEKITKIEVHNEPLVFEHCGTRIKLTPPDYLSEPFEVLKDIPPQIVMEKVGGVLFQIAG